VPVVIVRRRDVGLDGRPPLYLYGYGSYEACMDPDFGYDWLRSLPSSPASPTNLRSRCEP
jgi:protease II